MNSESRICANCGTKFVIDAADFDFYRKIGVPPPTFCPPCRYQRRLMFRNERNYYRRSCDLCKRNIISVYSDGHPFSVYCQKCWWGDGWDPASYGRDFDFSRPFFEQYKELADAVPRLSIQNDDGVGSVNSEYSYDWAFSKNVYMCVCGWYTENTMYGYYLCYDKEVADCFFVHNSELAYECVNCERLYNSKYCTLCYDCNGCVFGYDLRGCSDCVMCVGLRSKRYCIKNEQYSKEEYERKIAELNLESRSSIKKLLGEFSEFYLKFPRKFAYNLKTLNSTGDLLREVKNSRDCFYIIGPMENCRYVVNNDRAKDTYDCNNTGGVELCYESVTPDNSRGNKFSIFCWKCIEAEYSDNCHSCVSVLGCTGLKRASYAVLNKRYSKEDFLEIRTKIIKHMEETGEWGEFFPHASSPFAYNETAAIELFNMEKNEVLSKGMPWKDENKRDLKSAKNPAELPDTINEIADSFTGEVVACEHAGACNERCTEAFRTAHQEISFYKRMHIPVPTLCPNCRHYARLKIRNKPELYHRRCACAGSASDNSVYANTKAHSHGVNRCPNEFETSYAPDRPEIVYCESCYNGEII